MIVKNWINQLICLGFVVYHGAVIADKPLEGFGSTATGGAGGDVYHVTTLNNDGAGSLREAVSQGNRTVIFDLGGEIVLDTPIRIRVNNLTIDGSTAPAPGITIKKSQLYMSCLGIENYAQNIIIRYLRVQGMWKKGDESVGNNLGTMYFDGLDIHRVVLDHITTRNAYDSGLDIWGAVRDITIQYSLIAFSLHPQTISHYPAPFLARKNISIHHCIYAGNEERNPQMRALSRNIDYVNNIVYDWRWYGIRIKNNWTPGEPKVSANLINNAFFPTERFSWALVYGESPGADSRDLGPPGVLPQGTVYEDSDMDSLYVSGNLFPPENIDHYSTIAGPLPIPEYARVRTYDVSVLADSVVPFVGTHYPLNDETAVFETVQQLLRGNNPAGVADPEDKRPLRFVLSQNFPNPFNPKTIINYELQITNDVDLSIYNLLGQKIATLVSEEQKAGHHQVNWDASAFTSGVYFCELTAGKFREVKKMVLIR